MVDRGTASELNEQLAQFERDTSTQIVVAIYRTMQSESSVADYTQRIAQTWGVGQKGRNNGAVLFVFVENHQMFIQTGYGLEGALPDATCFDITHNVIAPLFKQGDYTGGLKAGVTAMMQAVRGEYKGTGRTRKEEEGGAAAADSRSGSHFLAHCDLSLSCRAVRRTGKRGYGYTGWGGPYIGGFGGSGGGWSGGGSSGAAASVVLVAAAAVSAVAAPGRAGRSMRTKEFLGKLEHDRIVRAIAEAEATTSGEIRVFIQRGEVADAVSDARAQFERLGMTQTRERNAVLIFVAPRAQKFAVIGDRACTRSAASLSGKSLTQAMRAHFQAQNFTDAIVHAIREAGNLLTQHFPRRPDDRNELPDAVEEG